LICFAFVYTLACFVLLQMERMQNCAVGDIKKRFIDVFYALCLHLLWCNSVCPLFRCNYCLYCCFCVYVTEN